MVCSAFMFSAGFAACPIYFARLPAFFWNLRLFLKLIYTLLRERKYTLEGAKDFIKKNKKVDEKFEMIEHLKKLKSFLLELKATL